MNSVRYSSSSSESSDGESTGALLDYSRLRLDIAALGGNLEAFEGEQKKSLSEVETLWLNHNRLPILPENLFRFTALKRLDISSNGLTVLPDLFKYCPLHTLIAKNNNLTDESFPKSFTPGAALRELNLSGNNIKQFPEQVFVFAASLKYLYLGGNQIVSISRNIWKLSSLHILSIGGNLLTEVPSAVGTLKHLQALVLCDNQLEELPPNIAQLRNLKSLMLHKNQIRTLPPEIVTLKNLTELSLRDNPLVVRFVTDMTHTPASLLELSARTVKLHELTYNEEDLPATLAYYLKSAHHCVNPKCRGVFFDSRIEHIKFVDFCGKYRIPLLQYLCSSKCVVTGGTTEVQSGPSHMMRKVLLG